MIQALSGPFRLGLNVPGHYQGWLGHEAEAADRKHLVPYLLDKQPEKLTPTVAWKGANLYLPGQVGDEDCAVAVAAVLWAATWTPQSRHQKLPNAALLYALSRNHLPPRPEQPGTTIARVIAAANLFGVLWQEAPYTVLEYRRMAQEQETDPQKCCYANLLPMTSKCNLTVVELKEGKEVVDWLRRGGQAVIGGYWAYRMVPSVENGHHYWVQYGRWQHVTPILGWDDELKAAYRLSTWGFDAHGFPCQNMLPGGAWNKQSDLVREIEEGGSVCYGLVLKGAQK